MCPEYKVEKTVANIYLGRDLICESLLDESEPIYVSEFDDDTSVLFKSQEERMFLQNRFNAAIYYSGKSDNPIRRTDYGNGNDNEKEVSF